MGMQNRFHRLYAVCLEAVFVVTAFVVVAPLARAQASCERAAAWTACDISFDLTTPEATPQASLRAEFRSPHYKTILINAFRQGTKLVLRVAATEPGAWTYKITSSVARLDGQSGQFTATASNAPGYVLVANVHHFQTGNFQFPDIRSEEKKPHLWMGAPLPQFETMPRADFDRTIEQRAKDRFTHLQVTVAADANLDEAAERIRAVNAKGLVVDVAFASLPEQAAERQRYVTEIVARFSAFNVTWAGLAAFENTPHARALLKDAGALIKKLDPYAHPRTTLAASTSGPVANDGWANVLSYGTPNPEVGGVEHQFYGMPAVNSGIQSRADLWNATMNGQYPASGDPSYLKPWFDFLSASRYWELEPYFDVQGGRAIALDGVEYLVYVEKPGMVTLNVESHSYDVAWMNPATGEIVKEKKDHKGEHFMGTPPDASHDWVLRVSREGHKEGMLKSYRFDSLPVVMQEPEIAPVNIPFEIASPEGDELSMSKPAKFTLKVKRDNIANRTPLVEWTLEQPGGSQGYRVVGAGREGTFAFPTQILDKTEGVVSLRANIVNALGKVYTLDKVYRLVP
jgi:hypothetical protein